MTKSLSLSDSLSWGLDLDLDDDLDDDLGLTLLRLSVAVRAMGSESLLRRRRERGYNFVGEERAPLLLLVLLLL